MDTSTKIMSKLTSIKVLSESPDLNFIPSNYTYSPNEPFVSFDPQPTDSIPIIDFSLLTTGNPHQRSKVIHELGKACQDWGFFMVVNHGVPETVMKSQINAFNEFFNLNEEEKIEFEGKGVLDPIRCGTSFNASKDKVFFWRDFVKMFVHPKFHCPNKPIGFSEVTMEYCKWSQKVGRELLKGISESLGLDESNLLTTLNMDSSFQVLACNLYPPCPQPELAMGMPPHSDHGLLTLLIQNDVGGLQVQHNGKWINVNPLPNSILVNTGDHLEIFSNGKYRSVMHRATVNNKVTRISVGMVHGPSLDTIVSPALDLVNETHPAAYTPMTYREYLDLQQSNQLVGKSCLDRVRVK